MGGYLRVLTEDLRCLVKKPVGVLIRGVPRETVGRLKEALAAVKPVKLAAVGDVVSETLLGAHIKADLYVTDARSLRVKRREPKLRSVVEKVYDVRNPPGYISSEAEDAVKSCLKSGFKCWLRVEGEEDLLALVAVAEAPLGSVVLYGQPGEGIVLIQVDDRIKRWAVRLLDSMPRISHGCQP